MYLLLLSLLLIFASSLDCKTFVTQEACLTSTQCQWKTTCENLEENEPVLEQEFNKPEHESETESETENESETFMDCSQFYGNLAYYCNPTYGCIYDSYTRQCNFLHPPAPGTGYPPGAGSNTQTEYEHTDQVGGQTITQDTITQNGVVIEDTTTVNGVPVNGGDGTAFPPPTSNTNTPPTSNTNTPPNTPPNTPLAPDMSCLTLSQDNCYNRPTCYWLKTNIICLPVEAQLLKQCSYYIDSQRCYEDPQCAWNLETSVCSQPGLVLAAPLSTCASGTPETCNTLFKCVWSDVLNSCITTDEQLELNAFEAGYEGGQDSNDDGLGCLIKTKPDCLKPTCFWDDRQICLPVKITVTDTIPSSDPNGGSTVVNGDQTVIINQNTGSGSSSSVESETESESESENGRPSIPGQGSVSSETESESESESESGYPSAGGGGGGTYDICFYSQTEGLCKKYPNQCYWDTSNFVGVCKSSNPVPIPQDCEGYVYSNQCMADERCIWKTECEENNYDCEDLYTPDQCMGAMVGGYYCIWLNGECDEAQVLQSPETKETNESSEMKGSNATNSYFFMIAALSAVCLVLFCTGVSIMKRRKGYSEQQPITLDELLLETDYEII